MGNAGEDEEVVVGRLTTHGSVRFCISRMRWEYLEAEMVELATNGFGTQGPDFGRWKEDPSGGYNHSI